MPILTAVECLCCVQVARRSAWPAVTLTSTCWTRPVNCLSELLSLLITDSGIKCQALSTQSPVVECLVWLILLCTRTYVNILIERQKS